MIKQVIDGIEYIFYERNLNNDNLVLIRYGNTRITTRQTKIYIDDIIDFISNFIEAGAVIDGNIEKYSTALTIYKAIRAILNCKKPQCPSKKDIKIAIDITKEILLMEIKDPAQRMAIKSAYFVMKVLIGEND